jgi:hypothetical protein
MFNLNEYEPVEARIKAFWEKYPEGRLHTELVHFDSSNFIVKASAYTDRTDTVPAATDYAHEVVGSSPVNKNFGLENCTTSALGRCLSTLGFSPKGKRPSREEMAKVQAIKEAKPLDWGQPDEIPLPPEPSDPFNEWPNVAETLGAKVIDIKPAKITEPNFIKASEKQVKFLFTLFKQMADRDIDYLQDSPRLDFIEAVISRRVPDYGLLSSKEASAVIKALQKELEA